MGEGWRVFFFWCFFCGFSFQILSVRFLCKFLCDFCAILFIFLCKILSKFLCGSIKGTLVGWDVLSLARLFGATFMELWNYGIMEYSITLLGLDWAREVGREVKYFVRGGVPRAKNRCSMGATLSKKLAIFLPIFFQTSEILQVLFYKIEILFLAYRRWGIKHLQVT